MPVLSKGFYIPPDHSRWLVHHLERVKQNCISCAKDILARTGYRLSETRMAQFIVLIVLQHVFGCFPSALHMSLRAASFSKVKDWIAALDDEYPGESTAYKHYDDIIKHAGSSIDRIAKDVQDRFQMDVEKDARERFTKALETRKIQMVPSADCFLGILSLSDVFNPFTVYQRGELLPYTNAWIYMHAKKITSINEFTGMLKTPAMIENQVYFPLASDLGFYRGLQVRTRS